MKVIVGQPVLKLLSIYVPQCGLSDSVKDLFFDQLRAVSAMIPVSEFQGVSRNLTVASSHTSPVI